VLEDDRDVHAGLLGDREQLVGLLEAERRRLLQEHWHTGLQALHRQRDVRTGWGADVREVQSTTVGPGLPQCGAQVCAPALDPVARCEVPGPQRLKVDTGDDHRPRTVGGDCGGVRTRDAAGADDQRAPQGHSWLPRSATSTARLVAVDLVADIAANVSCIIVISLLPGCTVSAFRH
jgi:hypothetical protein